MANEVHGIAGCVEIDGVKFENAAGWTMGISGEECEVVEFEDVWKELIRGVKTAGGGITAYHDQDAKILADLAQLYVTKPVFLYPDCNDTSTYYSFDAFFDFEHTADVGACQGQTAPFRIDGAVEKIGFECMLLKDAFNVDDPAPLGSPRNCLPGPGILTIDETAANFSILNGEFVWPAGGVWGQHDFSATDDTPAAYVRALGMVLKFRVAITTADEVWFGYDPTNTPTDELSTEHCIRALAASTGFDCHEAAASSPTLKDIWPALSGYAQIAIVLSPFDTNRVHWYPATALTSDRGAHYFFRDETEDYPHARLCWYNSAEHTTSLYPAFSNQVSAGVMDYPVIPCATFETPLLRPGIVDIFTGASALAAHTPDYDFHGTGWTEHDGSWTVGSGYVSPDASVPAHAFHQCPCPDKWVEAIITPGADTADIGLTLRESPNTVGGHNAWTAHIQSGVGGNDCWLDEYNDGAVTNRDVADIDFTVDTDYRMKVRMLDEEITVYIDDVEVLHYASAWFNKHAGQHGLYASGHAAAQFDDYLVLPVGSGLHRECYDNFDDTDGVRLNTTATHLDALDWVEDVGTWIIDNNGGDDQEADPDGTADAYAHVVTTAPNAWVTARALIPAADEWVGVMVRGSAPTMGGANYWYCEITNTADTDQQIVEVRDGVHTVRADADIDNAAQRWYIQVRCRDRDIRMWVDGTDELGYATAEHNKTAVWHGLYNDDHTDARFDQFRVTKINTYGEYDPTLDSIY